MPHVVIANPGADVYGSDLQMLESVSALVDAGHTVTVVMPNQGPLVPQLVSRGADVAFLPYPVLRRTDQSLSGLARLAFSLLRALPRIGALLRRANADIVYVNTVTIPWWLLAGRLARAKVVCHVHEAEEDGSRAARIALYGPLLLTHQTIVNGRSAQRAAVSTVPKLAGRVLVVLNGVVDRPEPPFLPVRQGGVTRVGVVARLSPRKGTLDALAAVAAVQERGVTCELHLFGSVFPGYEWYEHELRARSAMPDLAGRVRFHGYARPVWSAFDSVDIVLAPSHCESSGNSVVEAQLSWRPVIASRAAGHLESVVDGESGILVDIGDVDAMASAICCLTKDPVSADRLAISGRSAALDRNSIATYRSSIERVIDAVEVRRR